MRKKSLLLSLTLPLFFSCSNGDDSRLLLYKKEGIDNLVEIETAEEFEYTTRYDDCVVFVKLQGCHYCKEAKEYLIEYIKETENILYEVDRDIYLECYKDETNSYGQYANLYPKLATFPALLFFSSGKLKDAFLEGITSLEGAKAVINKNIRDYPVYLLNDIVYSSVYDSYTFLKASDEKEEYQDLFSISLTTETLDRKLEEDEKKLILYSWRRCADCTEYKKRVFNPYLEENEVKVYMYELDGYMLLKRMEGEKKHEGLLRFSEFSKTYHLDIYPNEDADGNIAGFAPTIIIQDSEGYVGSVFRNQKDPIRNDDGTLSYQKAFYPELTEVKSKRKVEEGDTVSTSYQKALKDLQERVDEVDIKLNREFLEKNYA